MTRPANNSLITGVQCYLQGLRLLNTAGLRAYILWPLCINTLLFAALIYVGIDRFDALLAWLLPDIFAWLRWLLWPIFALTALLVVFYAFALFANLIAAPFNGMLAEAVEIHLRGVDAVPAFSWSTLLRQMPSMISAELAKLLYFTVRALPLLLLFLIPGVNLVAPLVWLAFCAWLLALEYLDYPMGNHGILFKAQRAHLKAYRGGVFGFGSAALLMTLIPVVNFLAMPAAVAGATALWTRISADRNSADAGSSGQSRLPT